MATKNCAYMLDVLIGEMMLKDPPSILDYRRNPLCPILQIQSNVIPTVYIPFLTAESVSNHLGHIRTGHNFLPLEVEESYLNNGKFNFHSGKSCLFTTSSELRPSEGLLSINILNSFCFPPTEFGKCQHRFDSTGEIKGKLEFYNGQGNVVAYIGICISLKVIGQGVAVHSNKLKNEQSYETLRKYTLAENVNNQRCVTKSESIDALGIDSKCSSNINDGNSLKKEPIFINSNSSKTNTGNVLRSIKQNDLSLYECSYEPLKSTKNTESIYKTSKGLSSEEIALQLAELENNYNFIQNDHDLQYYEFQEKEVHIHPPSIVYSSTDKESEREWNRKLAKLVSEEEEERVYEESLLNESSESLPSRSSSSIYTIDKISVLKDKVKKQDHKTKECTSQNKMKFDKSIRNKPRLKGFLRSTPVITQSTSSKQPQAKQTRTTLLRKSKTDPELAKQMQLEIERQVKQKLKILDANFKSEMEGFKSKRSHKNKLVNERLCSGKRSSSSEQLRTKGNSDEQKQHFLDSNKMVSSRNTPLSQLGSVENRAPSNVISPEKTASQQYLHHREIESNIHSKSVLHKENNFGNVVNIDEYRTKNKQSYLNNDSPSNSEPNEKLDSRQLDIDLKTFDTSADKRKCSSGSIDAMLLMENYPEEVSIGESLLSNSTIQNEDNEELSNNSQVDSNRSKVNDALINYQRKDSTQENNSIISNHVGSMTKSEPKRNSSRSSTNKLRERKIHESYKNLSNSIDSKSQQKNISLLKKGSGSKSSSHKSHTANKKTITSVDSIVDSETESQATDISEDILEEDKIEITKNCSYSYSSDRLSSSSDLVLSEGAITADDSSVNSQIISNMSRIKSDEEVYSKAENHRKLKSNNSVSSNVEHNSILSGSRSEDLQQSIGKYSYSEDNSINLSSSQANPKRNNDKIKKAPLGIDDVDSSISDISARIAALLMPRSKPNVVQSFQTDSISSYVPSSMDGSLSSLSDI